MLTAKDGVWDEVEGLDTGADDYLIKPFCVSGVDRAAPGTAPQRRAGRPTVLEAGGLRLDPATRRGSGFRGEQIELTPREFGDPPSTWCGGADEAVASATSWTTYGIFDFDGDPNIVEVYVRQTPHQAAQAGGRRQ